MDQSHPFRSSQSQREVLEERDGWLKAIDSEGNPLGYVASSDARRLGLRSFTYEPIPRWLYDDYITLHAELLYEQGMLTSGQHLNEVQQALLTAALVRRREVKEQQEEERLMGQMMVNNPAMYREYLEIKQQQEVQEENEGIEWRAPSSPEEFAELLKDLDALEVSGSAQTDEGAALFSEDDFQGMSD